MKQKIGLVAEQAITDRDTGSVSLVGLLFAPVVHSFPFVFPYFSGVFFLEKEEHDPKIAQLTFRLQIGGKEVLKQPATANFGDAQFAYFVMRLNGLVVEAPGKVIVEMIDASGKRVGYYDFDVLAANPLEKMQMSQPLLKPTVDPASNLK